MIPYLINLEDKMSEKSYAAKVNAAKLMLAGLTANKKILSRRGLDDVFIETLTETFSNATSLDNEQEALKARLKEKTAKLDSVMKDMDKLLSESRKIVKIDIPQESWKEFGILDKR